ncbi:lytic transglycosylase domain-containing protein [Roseobacteraceae bacterium NS-SX3]
MLIRPAAVVIAMLAAPLAAQETPPPFPEFSAKRVTPPKPGTRKRITVQIEAAAAQATVVVASALHEAPRAAGRYGWFWEQLPPEAGPGRLEPALQALGSGAGQVSAPRLQAMQDIAGAQGVAILTASAGTRISPALALAVIAVESAGRTDAVSSAGAQGLMQLMPDTAARFGVSDVLEAQQNIAGGIKYLDWLMGEFGGDPVLVLAGYNAGENAVRAHQGVPPYAETLDYVPKVLAAYQVARGLCVTPPQLISDGCVFRGMN